MTTPSQDTGRSDDNEALLLKTLDLQSREAAAGGPEKMIRTLTQNLNRQARLVHWTIVSVSLSFVLTLCLAITGYVVYSNTASIDQNVVNAQISCRVGNEFKTADNELWDAVTAIPSLNFTPEQKADIAALVDLTFKTRDCP